jgi:hypothetical protein
MAKPKPERDPRPQAEKFKDLALELECDEDQEAFDERLKKVAKPPKAQVPGTGDAI